MKKCKLITFMVLCIMLLSTGVQASTLSVVNSNSENYILNDDMKFTKKIINYNKETQEAEIELCIKNVKKNKKNVEDIEVVIVLDNSDSMTTIENSKTRKNITYDAAYKFIGLLYDNIKKLSVGVDQYATSTAVVSGLTDSKEEAIRGLQRYKDNKCTGSTNTHIALKTAESQFTMGCKNRVVVLVTDGYPNNANETKEQLKKLENDGIYVLSMIVSKQGGASSIKNIFGTEEKPTAGNVYYIENGNEIERIFNEYMYNQILNYMEHPITNVKIEDVFPEELLEYFDIEYVNEPDKGKVSNLEENSSFVWSIDKITGEEVLVFKYKIKIKKDVDITEIMGIELKTNEKVIIDYEDEDGNKKHEELDKNPVVKLEETKTVIDEKDNDTDNDGTKNADKNKSDEKEYVIVDVTPKDEDISNKQQIKVVNNNDNSTKKERLPQTGDNDNLIYVIGVLIALTVGFGIKWNLISKKINKSEK